MGQHSKGSAEREGQPGYVERQASGNSSAGSRHARSQHASVARGAKGDGGSGSYSLPSNMASSRVSTTSQNMMGSSQKRNATSKKRHVGRIVAVVASLAVVAVCVIGILKLAGVFDQKATVTAGQSVSVTIPEGATTTVIAQTLQGAGVIDDSAKYIKYVQDEGYENSLKPGTYDMTTGMDYGSVTNLLLTGPGMTGLVLTIPEGQTIEQTAATVESTCGIPAQDYIALAKTGAPAYAGEYTFLQGAYNDSLEGYLFPKTYEVPEGATADTIIRLQLDQFETEVGTLDLTYAQSQGLGLAQVVTMASLIEKEAMVDSDRPKIASVIYNRLALPMRLQMDSTVIYAMGDAATGQQLSTDDTQIDSPYNTYLIDGLPPGPICNPGLASIKAAAAPEQTDYLYYVLTSKDGTQTFCSNYDDFLAAKEVYKEVFGVE